MPDTLPAVRRVPSLLGVLVAVVCSLAIVAGPAARPAAAFAPAVPIIGGAVSAAPTAGSAAAVGGLCATGVGCLALGVVALGITAYATHDTWMPWAEGFFNSLRERNDGSTGLQNTCGAPPAINPTYDPSTGFVVGTPGFPYAPLSWSSGDTSQTCWRSETSSTPTRFYGQNLRCVAEVAGTYENAYRAVGDVFVRNIAGFYSTGNNFNSHSLDIKSRCPNGSLPQFVEVFFRTDAASDGSSVRVGYSDKFAIEIPIPENLWRAETEVTCKRPDGSTFVVAGSETGHPDRMPVPSCRQADPTSVPTEIGVKGNDGNDLLTYTSPDYMLEYPNCFGPSGLQCTTKVFFDGQECTTDDTRCQYWWHHRDNPERVECRFGSYVVPVANCEPLKRLYEAPGGNPWVIDSPNPQPNPQPEPSTPPDPNPTGTTPPDPNPTGTATPDPEPCVGALCGEGDSPDPEDGSGSCLGSTWSWNPVSWVYAPVKCVFLWAFVPKSGAFTATFTSIRDAWADTLPGKWVLAVGDFEWPSSAGAGCQGPHVNVDLGSWVGAQGIVLDTYPLEACSGAKAQLAALSKLVLTVCFGFFGALACVRAVGSGFNWNPGVSGGGPL